MVELLRTITIGSCVSVQGTFVKEAFGERVAVEVDGKVFEGKPVDIKVLTPKVC